MDNRKKYRFDDFTLNNYRKLIQLAKIKGYRFSFFHEKHGDFDKQVLWRHDVEFSPFIALKMAQIEFEEGVNSTYFFQLHGECYNLLEKEISNILCEISEFGHEIGLHFDAHYFNIGNERDIDKYLNMDLKYFNCIFDTQIKAFSFHNTNSFTLSCEKARYAELINVYSKYFKKDFQYCADSTGYWRYEQLMDVLNDLRVTKLHVLTHDAMWSDEVLSPRQRVFKSIDDNALRIKRWYDKTLLKFAAKNVDRDKVYE